jgi:hypothetical protein
MTPDETFIIVASGPSLTKQQTEYIEQYGADNHIVVVNDNYKRLPWADYLFAADLKWWRLHYKTVCETTKSYTELHTIDRIRAPLFRNINEVKNRPLIENDITRNISDIENTNLLYHGGCSGILAMEFARIRGAAKIILVGYDMQHTGGKSHWFGDHPKGFLNANCCERWVNEISDMMPIYKQLGIDVVNCSIETAIDSVRRSTLEKELK